MFNHLERFFNSLWDKFQKDEQAMTHPSSSSSSSSSSSWELDLDFFKAMSQWTKKHPESSLKSVMDKIFSVIESSDDMMQFIPDSPFPARTLVTALVSLLRLGVKVSEAKSAVFEFAKQVADWLDQIQANLKGKKKGRFSLATIENLVPYRDLINEICTWATARLDDGRWSSIVHGLAIAKEIEDFKARIATARALFMDVSILNVAGGIDTILEEIEKVRQNQNDALKRISDKLDAQEQARLQTEQVRLQTEQARLQTEQALEQARLLAEQARLRAELAQEKARLLAEQARLRAEQVQEQARLLAEQARLYAEQVQARETYLARMLKTVADPTYINQGKLPCDEQTRVEVLAEIMEWRNDKSDQSQGFLWLTGDPGAGKSAITASIARACKDDKTLWAQFFINRNNAETTNPTLYFPSIARQFIDHSAHPDVAIAIVEALERQPSLMDGISHSQASQLFLNAFTIACASDQEQPVVVVIDGLDETDPGKLAETAQIFSEIFSSLSGQTTRNAKVLIASRTDDDIRTPFAKMMDPRHVKHIHLDTSAPSSIRDVSTYLAIQIARIVKENDLNWLEWPGEARMDALCNRASGLFIWAVTVAKFFQDQIHDIGTECLNDLIDAFSAEGTGNINTLYLTVMQLAYRDTKDAWRFETFRRIVGCVAALKEPLPISVISKLLNLRRNASSSPVDVIKFFRRTRTVLVAGADVVDGETVPRLHKSFFEFITSKHADSKFRVDIHTASGELALQSIRQLGYILKQKVYESALDLPESRYALRFWGSHLGQEEKVVSGLCVVRCGRNFKLCDLDEAINRRQTRFWEADGPPMEVDMVTSGASYGMMTGSHKLISISDGRLISKPISHSWVPPPGHHRQLMNTASGSPFVRHGLPGLPRNMCSPFFFNVMGGWNGSGSRAQMEWIPFKHRGGSTEYLWAYTGGALIRSNGLNSVVMLDLREDLWPEDISLGSTAATATAWTRA
ncbi:hypothetical protein FIBSPDRAFT_925490 [Athelia psychrophila]|uniref:Nephrocystin 3-like N-terminal domain-containing protein n=1 Tax=Athelia psychrophila TaxID=1759441 RepID=A0A166UWW4_9AGAM|nr:hypothetical protein FIBSPDRAFT_925490 [Fibularhizoctonia sp. CBS 109695]